MWYCDNPEKYEDTAEHELEEIREEARKVRIQELEVEDA